MNWRLNRLNVEWIADVSLLVIPWMIDLSGELSHVLKNVSITATHTPQNDSSVPVNLPKSSLKKKTVRHQRNVVCLVEFWRCDSLGVRSKRARSRCGIYSQQLEWVNEILRRRYPALVNRNRVFLQQDNARPQTVQHQTMTKIQEFGGIPLLPHPQHTAMILCLQITLSVSIHGYGQLAQVT